MTNLLGLTGGGTVVLAVLLLLGISAGTVICWNRLSVLGRWVWPARAALFGASQLSAIVVTALVLNNAFVFYQSWAELFGAHPKQDRPAAAAGLIDARLAPELKLHARLGLGTTTTLDVPGTVSGVRTGPALVYLPPQYGDPAYADRAFPVVELLDGFPGSPYTWFRTLHLATVMNGLIATGRSVPFVIVAPVQNVDSPHDTECVNVPGGPQVDDYLTYDVRSAVEHNLRVSTAPGQWAVMGDSTGGYCAADIALQHTALFGAAVSISGYDAPAHDGTTGNLWGKHPAQADFYSPLWLMQHRQVGPMRLLLTATRRDSTAYNASVRLSAAARPPVAVSTLVLPEGGHNFATFAAELPAAFGWISHNVATALAPIPTVDGLSPQPAIPSRPKHHPVRGRGAETVKLATR
ncbi:MAG TPA: alpha/beta hydrolase-fold protein [Jatrophihabitans sp.]|nr:alpha/beta hydrolase-fold protein [Jatrophihabitans sp.]